MMQLAGVDGQKAQKIDSLQALRALAFLGVFFEHAKFIIRWPALGVSIFFVLSGFLLTYRYENVELSVSPKDCLAFSLKKIRKLYPLHILTMLCAMLPAAVRIAHNGADLSAIISLGEKVFLNCVLLQTWVPDCLISTSLNGVAWYLSATMFLYFMFPWLKRVIERNSIGKLCILCAAILIAEIIVCIPALRIWGDRSVVYIWFRYNFPVFRLGDFFFGCVLKRVFFECKAESIGTIKATVYELLATAMTVVVFFWCAEGHSNVVLQALNNWTTPYIPIAAVWVLLFAANKGLLTRVLFNRITLAVGNISAFAFLIHNIVTMYTSHLLTRMDISLSGWRGAIIVFAELAVSIALSFCYMHLDRKYISKHFFANA